jgi:hypothetical protein
MRLAGLAPLGFALVLVSCGGATPTETQSAAIPRSVAERLAAQSESLAAALEAGDTCGAAQDAVDLRRKAEAAIGAGDIPAAYQNELAAAVTRLEQAISCEEQDSEGEGHGEGKAKGHDKHADSVTTEESTTTQATTSTDTTPTDTTTGGG